MARIPIEHQRTNGRVVPITPQTFRLDATFRPARRKRSDQLLGWALFGAAVVASLVALVGFCLVFYFLVLFIGGVLRRLIGGV